MLGCDYEIQFYSSMQESKMTLNGWQRLGVVIFVFWLAGTGYLAYENISDLYTAGKFSVNKPEIGKVIVKFSKAQGISEAQRHIEEDLLPEIQRNPAQYVGKLITKPYDDYVKQHQRETIGNAVKLLLLPPLILLTLGWSIAWVRRGFKAQK